MSEAHWHLAFLLLTVWVTFSIAAIAVGLDRIESRLKKLERR